MIRYPLVTYSNLTTCVPKTRKIWALFQCRVSSQDLLGQDMPMRYMYIHIWYVRILKCSGLAFTRSKWFINTTLYITIQLFSNLPSWSGGWMSKQVCYSCNQRLRSKYLCLVACSEWVGVSINVFGFDRFSTKWSSGVEYRQPSSIEHDRPS